MKLILGVNGLVWVGLSGSHEPQDPQRAVTSTPEHETIARVANAVRVLAALDLSLTPTRISEVYQVWHVGLSFSCCQPLVIYSESHIWLCGVQESVKSGIAIYAMLHQSYQLLAIATEIKQRLPE